MKTSIIKITALFIGFIILFSVPVSSFAFSFEEENVIVSPVSWTQNQLNIAARSDYMYDLTWVCKKTVTGHAQSDYYTYYAGNTYHMPYGEGAVAHYIGYGVTPEDFLIATGDVNSIFYTQRSYSNSWYSTYYIQDCAGFVSWCWGLSSKQTTKTIPNVSNYVSSVTESNVKSKLQLGDAINKRDKHVVLVTDIFYDGEENISGIEITEQAIPETKRTVYTLEKFISTYSNFDGIYRYNGTVPDAPSSVTNKLENNAPTDMGKDFYARVKHTASGKYIADVGGSVYAKSFSGESDQVWHFMRQASGAYLVGNGATSKFWEVRDASYEDGTPLVTNKATFSKNQKFYIYYINNNFYFMPEGGDKTLDVAADSLITQIYGNTTGKDNQDAFDARSFNLEIISVYDGTKTISDLGSSFTATIKNVSTEKFLTASGTTLIGANKTNGNDQKWLFTRQPNGSYTIVSVQQKTAIDVYNTLVDEGTSVDLHPLHNGNAQTFFIVEVDGTYYIKSSYTVNALHMDSKSFEFYTYSTGSDWEKLVAQKFEIDIIGSDKELILKETSPYVKDGKNLLGVVAGETTYSLLSHFKNTKAVVSDLQGATASSFEKVGTGYTVRVISSGTTLDSLTIIIKGDVSGEGSVDGTDYLRIKSAFLGTFKLEGAYFISADVDSSGVIDTTDYLRVKAHFLGTYNIFQ